jgi:hypothetical protein
MVAEMQTHLTRLFKERAARSLEAPQELKDLEARLERLRNHLREGDPDMAADELSCWFHDFSAGRRCRLAKSSVGSKNSPRGSDELCCVLYVK